MKSDILKLSLCFCVLCIFQNSIFGQSSTENKKFPEITLERTEIRVLHSEIVGQDYELNISFPFINPYGGEAYPVIFILDPFRDFVMTKGISDVLMSSQQIPRVMLVGIGYGGKGFDALQNYALGRLKDYIPVQDSAKEEYLRNMAENMGIENLNIVSGKAPEFLEFIKKELVPFLESNYNVDTNKCVLSGYSDAGLFALYALFHEPELFSGYLIGSPSIQFKNELALEYESKYAKTHKDLRAKIFMSAGEDEELTANNVRKMDDMLNSRNYQNLKLKTVILENENHATSYPSFINRGLMEIFKMK